MAALNCGAKKAQPSTDATSSAAPEDFSVVHNHYVAAQVLAAPESLPRERAGMTPEHRTLLSRSCGLPIIAT
jgi:hypothetical protein